MLNLSGKELTEYHAVYTINTAFVLRPNFPVPTDAGRQEKTNPPVCCLGDHSHL